MSRALILAYPDRFSAFPGETLSVHASCEGVAAFDADLVRLRCGYADPAGPGFSEVEVESGLSGPYAGRFQPIHPGSHVRVVDVDRALSAPPDPLTLRVTAWPTLSGRGEQVLMGCWRADEAAGYALMLDEKGRAAFRVGDGTGAVAELTTHRPLEQRVWYRIEASFDAQSGHATLTCEPLVTAFNSRVGPLGAPEGQRAEGAIDAALRVADGSAFLLGAAETHAGGRAHSALHFNGKLEGPAVLSGEQELASWNFSVGIGPDGIAGDHVADVSGNDCHGTCANLPARGMTGSNWSGWTDSFVHAPEEYGAIHFHEDDLEDAGWEPDVELAVPEGLQSGLYAVRLRARPADGADVSAEDAAEDEPAEEHVPFVVRARPDSTAKAVVLLPTASYLAYANDHQGTDGAAAQSIIGHAVMLGEHDLVLAERRELGLSMYDSHLDGSGVCYSTRLRPILTMRPKYLSPVANGLWGFNADLNLFDWLDETEQSYDVVTDEDLDREGVELLRPYNVVMTGTHPEYTSPAMLDALEEFVASGGRLMYLGGDGFYWVTTFHPDKPHVVEVRRGQSGIRAWEGKPGEGWHASTGQPGGLWRNRGRPPQKLAGVGFAAEGFDRSSYFRLLPDATDPRAAFVFEGVEGDVIGDYGLAAGGAAGHELDRYELDLGTPPQTLLLGASEGHTDAMLRVIEEVQVTRPGLGGTQDPDVRADMTLFAHASGGGVFSTGSIAWCSSLSWNDYENDVARITSNVLARFLEDDPLPT